MIPRLFNTCLLRPEDLAPSRDDFEVVGAFNPGAVDLGDEVALLVRVAERPAERRPGFTGLPRWEPGSGVVVDWTPNTELEALDPRVALHKRSGRIRLTSISHLRVARSADGRSIDSIAEGRFEPESEYETFGVEDPRITRLGDEFHFTYVAVSPHGAATALASTSDFRTFRRRGVIFPPENKDVALFPDKMDGEYAALHRPNPATHFSAPEMWVARSRDLVRWGGHEQVACGGSAWDSGRVGGGAPPIRTEEGWLEIYHGNQRPARTGEVGAYAAGAMLLDPERAGRVLRRCRLPIMAPEADFETDGFTPDVVFPTGVVDRGDTILVYYGAADTCAAVVEFSMNDIMSALRE